MSIFSQASVVSPDALPPQYWPDRQEGPGTFQQDESKSPVYDGDKIEVIAEPLDDGAALDLTLFDSTGLAIQDLAIAVAGFEAAQSAAVAPQLITL